MMRPLCQRGFTLLEALIAGFILFSLLTAFVMLYRNALLASARAERAVAAAEAVPWIADRVRDALRSDPATLSGNGALMGTDYRWTASLLRHLPPRAVQEDVGEPPPPRFRLYDIRLTVERDRQTWDFDYRELAWDQEPS